MSNHFFIFPGHFIQILFSGMFAFFVIFTFAIPVSGEAGPYPSAGLSSSVSEEETIPDPFSDTLPTILELQLFSNNACNPLLAVDNDQVILEFTLAAPCYSGAISSPIFPLPGYLFCLRPDLRHWCFVFQIQNGWLPDQSRITAEGLLRQIFSGHYRYYGSCNAITYLAPIEAACQVFDSDSRLLPPTASASLLPPPPDISSISVSGQAPSSSLLHDPVCSIVVTGNHALTFLSPEQIHTKTGSYWTISVTDEGGNGLCCITVPLESPETLLYNLTSLEACTYQIDLYQP